MIPYSKAKATKRWIYFFKNSEIKEGFQAKGLKEAEEKLQITNMSEEEYRAYQHYLDNLHYQASIAETLKFEAEEKVRRTRDAEIVKNGIAQGLDKATIAAITNLTIEEVEQIIAGL